MCVDVLSCVDNRHYFFSLDVNDFHTIGGIGRDGPGLGLQAL